MKSERRVHLWRKSRWLRTDPGGDIRLGRAACGTNPRMGSSLVWVTGDGELVTCKRCRPLLTSNQEDDDGD